MPIRMMKIEGSADGGRKATFLNTHKSKSNSRKISFKHYNKFLNNLILKTILLFYFKFTKN